MLTITRKAPLRLKAVRLPVLAVAAAPAPSFSSREWNAASDSLWPTLTTVVPDSFSSLRRAQHATSEPGPPSVS